MTDGPATTYARAARTWEPLDWWKLEARALHGVPELRRSLAYFAPTEAWKDLSRGVPKSLGCLLTLSHIASFTLPLIAAVVMGGWLLGRSDVAPVGVAGILAGIAAVIAGIGIVDELRNTVGSDPKVVRMLGWLHLAPSLAGGSIAVLAIARGEAIGGLGVIGFLTDVIVGVLQLVLFRAPAKTGTGRWQRNFVRLERGLASMKPDERARVYADLQRAIEVLSMRELITPAAVDFAREAPIGMLGITMAPREDLLVAQDLGKS